MAMNWRKWKVGLLVACAVGFFTACAAAAILDVKLDLKFFLFFVGLIGKDVVLYLKEHRVEDIDDETTRRWKKQQEEAGKSPTPPAALLLILFFPFVMTLGSAHSADATLLTLGAVDAPMARTVWIAASNYGSQKGTRLNPLDGSTAEKFDALMRAFPPHTTVNLLSGVFLTTGSASYNEGQGWWVKTGWKVRGRGPDKTIVRQVNYPLFAWGSRHGTFEMTMYDTGGVEIADLTVDENWPAFESPSNTCTFAVALRGDNCTIRNVRALRGHGDVDSLLESFSITIAPRYNGGWEINTNGLIEGCVVDGYTGNYGVAIALMPTVKGRVRNCSVSNFVGTAPFGMSSSVVYENNLSVGCFGGYYTDTGTVTNVIVRNCRMLNGTGFAIHSNPLLGAAMVRDVLIEKCVIQARQVGVALSGQLGLGYQFGFSIRKNTFLYPTNGAIYPPAAIVAAHVDGLTVEDNRVDERLFSQLNWPEYPSTNVRARGNLLLGEPTGLEDK